ncbi:MAG: beta-N-acetylhexosaminidase [Clostridia bacterium]|nr:beta-N-acetylhexosaminidase [Clostridia bacterium]
MKKIRFIDLPAELVAGTGVLLEQLDLCEDAKGTPVTVKSGDKLSVSMSNGTVAITYHRRCEFFRALSYLPGVLAGDAAVSEKNDQTTLCLMADCSRNAVMSVEGVKRELRYLALMGFDSMMLYTEDTYEIEEYPYFGRMRGRYTAAELKELDDYADSLGIELIPCIQALAHLERALQWKIAFDKVSDTPNILLVGEEKTYEFIDAMLKTCASCFRSHRINLGMDEAHDLGRGKYQDKHGYRAPAEIMLEHLGVVTEMCKKYDFKPMIWSDMFYRMAFGGAYYVEEGDVPAEVMAKVPEGLTLIYWDYYTTEKRRARFSHMVESHLKFPNNEVMFASGAWGWSGFAPFSRFSLRSAEIQLEACQKYGMTDWIITSWGDNGRECTNFASLPVLLYFAEYGYSGKPDTDRLEARSRACFGIGFEELLTMDAPNDMADSTEGPKNPCKYLLFNDPLEGLMDAHMDPATISEGFASAEKRLAALADHPAFGYVYRSLAALCRVLVRKCDFSVRLRNAYLAGDRATMAALADETDIIVNDLDAFVKVFRKQWMTENKPHGFAVQDIRIGALRARLLATADRIKEYLDGTVPSIPELEEPVLPMKTCSVENPYIREHGWGKVVTTCIL